MGVIQEAECGAQQGNGSKGRGQKEGVKGRGPDHRLGSGGIARGTGLRGCKKTWFL
jgi:hypothetical protein